MPTGAVELEMLYDVSPPISLALCVWPGDLPFSREVRTDMAAGAATTGSALHMTAHLGAHADAPSHYGLHGATIDQCDLATYLGPCEVVRVAVPRGEAITPAMCGGPVRAPRVLFATGTFPDRTAFNEGFAALSAELIDWLAEQGVRLVGIDTPSVDLFAAEHLPVHREVLRHGLAILEGLVLDAVPAGTYELIALPLRIVGGDGSPVRAVLRTPSSS